MSDDKPVVKFGPPWKTVYSTRTYIDADAHRNKLLDNWSTKGVKDMQVKVKWSPSKDQFTVRTRVDPSVSSKQAKKGNSKKSKKKD